MFVNQYRIEVYRSETKVLCHPAAGLAAVPINCRLQPQTNSREDAQVNTQKIAMSETRWKVRNQVTDFMIKFFKYGLLTDLATSTVSLSQVGKYKGNDFTKMQNCTMIWKTRRNSFLHTNILRF